VISSALEAGMEGGERMGRRVDTPHGQRCICHACRPEHQLETAATAEQLTPASAFARRARRVAS
jgi:hypothetical protein